jgi:hypothetical protein
MRRIGRLVEDAFIEREPGQFTVDRSCGAGVLRAGSARSATGRSIANSANR